MLVTALPIFKFVLDEEVEICWKEDPLGIRGTIESSMAGWTKHHAVNRGF